MRAVGLSYHRLLRVPYLMTFALMALNFAIVGYLQPLARYAYEEMEFELQSGALGASIKVGEFNAIEDRMALRIEASRDCLSLQGKGASFPTATIATPLSCG